MQQLSVKQRIQEGEVDTTFLIRHHLSLEEAPTGYKNFQENQNEWTKVVLNLFRPSD